MLFRTGLGPRQFPTKKGTTFKVAHWFDQLSQVHRFQIHKPETKEGSVRVTYNSRITCDALIEKIKRTGRLEGISFGAKYDPCVSFFQKLQSVFKSFDDSTPSSVNVGVTTGPNFPGLSKTAQKQERALSKNAIETLYNKTDATLLQSIDPQTLEPLGVAQQGLLHPQLKGPMSAAHAKFDPVTGDVYNYNLAFGRTGTYRVFTVSAATGKTTILATIPHAAAYIHSMFLTENFIILCVWNSFYKAGGTAMLWKQNFVDALADYDGSKPTTWFVIDKKPGGRGLVATYESESFFAFHSVNAYEERSSSGTTDIVADIAGYPSLDCLKRFYIDNLLSNSSSAIPYSDISNASVRGTMRRYRLPNLPEKASTTVGQAIREFEVGREVSPELPTMNPTKATKKHRYVYGILDSAKSTFFDSLIKYDTETHTTKVWHVHGHTAGEPIFVADPESTEEDGGVLLSVVLNGFEGKSYLLVLDAKTMNEVGRAMVDGPIGFGFHGTHVSADRVDNWGT